MIKNIIGPRMLMKIMRFWPPYFTAGIKIDFVNEDFTQIDVSMKQRFYNTNYVGTHFGGSLYSMCDPFYMFILLQHLGADHIVWDKAAQIKFIKPGKGTVRASFKISLDEIQKIKEQAAKNRKIEPVFETYIFNKNNEEVALVHKTLYVRAKNKQ